MKKIVTILCGLLVAAATMAQQLPNPSFEDWSGETFDGNIQPLGWNASNVTQFSFKFNFAHREAGHTGQYSLMVQDQEIGAAGITEVSPGYASLGKPWVYIESLFKVSEATAGTHGGIDFTYRPDSMSVWVRRTGNNTDKERFYMVYYSWVGESIGKRFKGKNGNCTSVTYHNEESDIRQSMDPNECGTDTKATQVAEGCWTEFNAYEDWTQIRVPIYYMSDLQPEKMNIIFSASRYPEQRANSGLYAGNSLYVDDVELIYSNKIQRLYINDFEWKGFDPNSEEEQLYSLGEGATAVPTNIKAFRGAGSLKSMKKTGDIVTFPGRQLQGSEIQITNGVVDGAPTMITVTSGDGLTTRTYKIKFVRAASANAKLASITVNGEPLKGFGATLPTYNVSLPYGTTEVPVVAVEAQDAGATVQLTQATATNGQAVVTVTAADGTTTMTYTLNFSVAKLADNTLVDIKVNGESVPGFNPSQTIYKVSLPLGTTTMPTVEGVSAYAAGEQTINYIAPAVIDGGQYQIQVSTPGAQTPKTYKLNFKLEASSYAYLRDLQMAGGYIEEFDPEQLTYYINLPLGTTEVPAITWTTGDSYQTVDVQSAGLDGTTRVVVTAGDGKTQAVYKLIISTEKSTRSDLAAIYVGGQAIAGFSPEVLTYQVTLPIGTTTLPAITVDKGDEYESVNIVTGGTNGTTRIIVTAGDGSATIYQIAFSVTTSSDATLSMIYLDGTPLADFNPATLEYAVQLAKGTTSLPIVTYDQHDDYQTVTTRSGGLNGDYRLTVRPQTGASQTYILHFSVATSSNSSLAGIALDGEALEGFDPATTNYDINLPAGVSAIPAVTYTRGDDDQRVLVMTSGSVVTITVTAGNGSKTVYTLNFITQKSENALLDMIYLNGQPLANFESTNLLYTVTLPDGATCPVITVASLAGQQVTITAPYAAGTARIVVTPEQGDANVYLITFRHETQHEEGGDDDDPVVVEPSHDASLSTILIDGVALADFVATTTHYTINLPAGSTLPDVAFVRANDTASLYCGATAENVVAATLVAADGTTTQTYTVRFEIAPYDDATLAGIALDGVALEDFASEQYSYTRILDDGAALPVLTYITRPMQTVAMASSADSQTIIVTAESGAQATYTISYNRLQSANAMLANIYVGGVALEGFDPEVHEYTYPTLAQGTKVIPSIHPVGALDNQTITTTHCRPGGVATIHVVAQDGQSEADYTIAFPVTLSANTALAAIQIDEPLDFHFQSTQSDYYNLTLPYGSTESPRIFFDRGETCQLVDIVWAPIDSVSSLVVTAENGDTRTYHFSYKVAPSEEPNTLLSLSVNGIELDVNTLTQTVDLPYGTTAWTLEYAKRFPEQTVTVVEHGLGQPTTIRLCSHREGEEDAVYTLTPAVATYGPAVLSAIKVDDQVLADFRADRYDYVIPVTSLPAVTAEAAEGVQVSTLAQDSKHITFSVSAEEDSKLYTVYFYYAEDVIPSNNFTEWEPTANDGGTKPMGWYAPADAAGMYSWGSQGAVHPGLAVAVGGTQTVRLNSTQDREYNSIYGTVPGMITLGTIQMKLASNGGSSSSISGSVPFRNTPDQISVEYNPVYYKNMANWRLWVELGDGQNVTRTLQTPAYENTNVWSTLVADLDYTNLSLIQSLNITLNSATSDNVGDLGNGSWIGGTQHLAQLDVRNLHFVYNSTIAAATVDGASATIDGTTIRYDIADAEYTKVPEVRLLGAVADQMPIFTLADEVDGVRTTTIRNHGEDGSYTDYTLVISRALSSNAEAAVTVNGRDLHVKPASPHATVDIRVINADSTLVVVTAEDGTEREYPVSFAPVRSSSTELSMITAEGLSFVAATRSYTLVTETLPEMSFNRLSDGQTAQLVSTADSATIYVTAEDGTLGRYSIYRQLPETSAQLSELFLNGNEFSDFSRDTYNYECARPSVSQFTRVSPCDSVVLVQTPLSMSWQVIGSTEHTYTLTYPTELSANTQLAAILVGDTLIADFNAMVLNYEIRTNDPILLHAVPADPSQTVVATATADGVTFVVTAEDGTSATYHVTTRPARSSCALLADIAVDGVSLAGFEPATTAYSLTIPTADYKTMQPVLPIVAWRTIDPMATVELTTGALDQAIYLDVTAADGLGHTQYVLTISAEPSHHSSISGMYIDGVSVSHFETGRHFYAESVPSADAKVTITSLDAFQTVMVDTVATADGLTYIFHILAEDGLHTEDYQLDLFVERRSSDATLESIVFNGAPMSDFYPESNPTLSFDPNNNSYTIAIPSSATVLPEISARLKMDGQQVEIARQGEVVSLVVTAADGQTTNTYTLHFVMHKSSNTLLDMVYLNGEMLAAFDPATRYYFDTLAVGVTEIPEVVGQKAEPMQDVAIAVDSKSATITVTAEDGTIGEYHIFFAFTQSEADSLLMIYEDGVPMANFMPKSYFYVRDLPVGTTAFPELSWLEADQWQTVRVDTLQATNSYLALQLIVTSGSGRTSAYTVAYVVEKSDVDTLQMIYLDSRELPGFSGMQDEYSYTLPAGATEIPAIFYIQGDEYQTVTVSEAIDSIAAKSLGKKAIINVQAQSGRNRTYTIHFSVELSNDATLNMILFGGLNLSNFDRETYDYAQRLPEGMTSVPVITVVQREEPQQVKISVNGLDVTIRVLAEDGVSEATYTIHFVRYDTDCNTLAGISLDGEAMSNFSASVSDYTLSLPYGTTVLPTIEWTLGAEGQAVTVESGDIAGGEATVTITVVPASGEIGDAGEYVLHFVCLPNSDCSLLSLLVRSEPMEGFDAAVFDYSFTYADTCTYDTFFDQEDLTILPSDPEATVSVLSNWYEDRQMRVIAITVIAANGDAAVYTIEQRRLLASNCLLETITLDGVDLPGFSSTTTEYTWWLRQGVTTYPEIDAFPVDARAGVSIMPLDQVGDTIPVLIICQAEDKSEMRYHVYFVSTPINDAERPQPTDVIVKVLGDNQILVSSIRRNVSFALFDLSGRRVLFLSNILSPDPNNAIVNTDANGTTVLIDVKNLDGSFGRVTPNQLYLYCFFESGKYKIASGKMYIR